MKKLWNRIKNTLKILLCSHDSGVILSYYLDDDKPFKDCGLDSENETGRGKLKCRCNKCGKVYITNSMLLVRNKFTGQVKTIYSFNHSEKD